MYERSGGRLGASASGMRHLLLRTIGRRSGRPHVVCLPCWFDADGHAIVVASFSGSPTHPAWYLNLSDRARNAHIHVRDGRRTYQADVEILEGDDRARVWAALTADRPFYREYQRQTTRQIPLVRVREQRGSRDQRPRDALTR